MRLNQDIRKQNSGWQCDTASITPETAVKSTKDRNNNQNTSSLKTKDLPFDSVEFKSAEKNRQ